MIEIRAKREESKRVFEASPFDSDSSNETEKLFSAVAKEHSLISKGGFCQKELARGLTGGDFCIPQDGCPEFLRVACANCKEFRGGGPHRHIRIHLTARFSGRASQASELNCQLRYVQHLRKMESPSQSLARSHNLKGD